MRIEPRRVEAFLLNPAAARIVLLHGDDQGLVSDRAAALVRLVAGAIDDPFRVVSLAREDAAALPEEMCGLPLTGGRRVVHIHDAGDSITEVVRRALAGPGPGFAVLEAGNLSVRSKLRSVVEAATDAAAVACYPEEGASVRGHLAAALNERGVSADDEAIAWIAARVTDRSALRHEAEKLALFAGADGRIDLAAAMECVSEAGLQSLEDAVFAATAGDIPGADRALSVATAEGAAPVQIVRTALQHLQRLYQARLAIAAGCPAAEAAKTLRPPIFFKRAPSFMRSLALWPVGEIGAAAARLQQTERSCKTTGSPAADLAQSSVMALALRGAALARQQSSRSVRLSGGR